MENERLLRLSKGDPDALAEIYDEYYTPLVYFSMKIIHDPAESEDIALECFVKLWKNESRIETEGKLRGYLFKVARNACLDFLKHKRVLEKAESTLKIDDHLQIIAETSLIKSELLKIVASEIEKLPSDYREVIKMLFIYEKTSLETAQYLNISQENLRQRKARAVRHLKTLLLRRGVGPLSILFIFSRF